MTGATENGKQAPGWFAIDNAAIDVLLPTVGVAAFTVYCYLARRADNETRKCWPSVARISRDTKMYDRRVQRSLRDLEAAGAIKTQERRGQSAIYYLPPLFRGAVFDTPADGRVSKTTEDPRAFCHPTPALFDTQNKTQEQPSKKKTQSARAAHGAGGKRPEEIPIPEELSTEAFLTAWAEWLAYRRERKITLTERTLTAQLEKLAPEGATAAVDCIRDSIANGWQGLFPNRSNSNGRQNRGPRIGPGQAYDPEAQQRDPTIGRM